MGPPAIQLETIMVFSNEYTNKLKMHFCSILMGVCSLGRKKTLNLPLNCFHICEGMWQLSRSLLFRSPIAPRSVRCCCSPAPWDGSAHATHCSVTAACIQRCWVSSKGLVISWIRGKIMFSYHRVTGKIPNLRGKEASYVSGFKPNSSRREEDFCTCQRWVLDA